MRTRRVIGSMLTGFVLLGLAAPAASGGGNWLEVDDRHVATGQSITVKNRYFSRSDVAHGPYFAYLFVDESNYDPPLKVFRSAMVLGRVEIRWPPEDGWRGRRMPQNPVLVGRFQVPDVEPGKYMVHICNRPCTRRIDWVSPTTIRIAATPEGARLHERIDALKIRMLIFKHNDRRSERRLGRELRNTLESQVEALQADLAAARRLPVPTSRPSTLPIWIAIGLGALALTVSCATLLRTRRKEAPDWDGLLAELTERERVG